MTVELRLPNETDLPIGRHVVDGQTIVVADPACLARIPERTQGDIELRRGPDHPHRREIIASIARHVPTFDGTPETLPKRLVDFGA